MRVFKAGNVLVGLTVEEDRVDGDVAADVAEPGRAVQSSHAECA